MNDQKFFMPPTDPYLELFLKGVIIGLVFTLIIYGFVSLYSSGYNNGLASRAACQRVIEKTDNILPFKPAS